MRPALVSAAVVLVEGLSCDFHDPGQASWRCALALAQHGRCDEETVDALIESMFTQGIPRFQVAACADALRAIAKRYPDGISTIADKVACRLRTVLGEDMDIEEDSPGGHAADELYRTPWGLINA